MCQDRKLDLDLLYGGYGIWQDAVHHCVGGHCHALLNVSSGVKERLRRERFALESLMPQEVYNGSSLSRMEERRLIEEVD